MCNESRRQCVEFEVAHPVRANHHSRLLLTEGFNDGLQCMWRRVKVVTVELNGKSSAPLVIYRQVPTATNTQVIPLRNDMNEPPPTFFIPNS